MSAKIFLVLIFILVIYSWSFSQLQTVESIKKESFATYKLVHLLHTVEATSKEIVYRSEFDPAKHELKSISAKVDVTTFDSNNSNRDSHAMEVIDAIDFPDVIFSSTSIIQNGDSVSVTGNLTFHGMTNSVEANGTTVWSQNKLDIQGNFPLSLTAFKIERPSLLMIPVNDTLKFSLKAVFEWK